ncbi:MAG TPA: acyltransferase domain-containing protein, partial [Candidatus Xenobia bacterium]
GVDQVDVIQPVLYAVEVALAALWTTWGVTPDVVVGHSMGEVAASYVAGALSMADAVRVIVRRSRLLRRVSGQGAMAVVELSMAEAQERLAGLEDRLSVAVSNSPRSTVLSGAPEALDELLPRLEAEGVFCRRIKVDVASHSPQMDPLRDDLLAALKEVRPQAGRTPIHSAVTTQVTDGAGYDAAYWARNLREPVQFGAVIGQQVQADPTLFVELSPHPILLPAMETIMAGRSRAWGSLRREQPEQALMLETLGALWAAGYPLDWSRLYPVGRVVSAPTYPWQRERYWPEPQRQRALRSGPGGHPLMGIETVLAGAGRMRFWEFELEADAASDHRIAGEAVLSMTTALDMALAAARSLWSTPSVAVEGLVFDSPVRLPASLQVQCAESTPERGTFGLHAHQDDGSWSLMVRAALCPSAAAVATDEPIDDLAARCGPEQSGQSFYQRLAEHGYAPSRQGLRKVYRGTQEAVAWVQLPTASLVDMLENTLHLLWSLVDRPYVPVGVTGVQLHATPGAEAWCHIRTRMESGALEADVRLLDAGGRPMLDLAG